jgi:parallel beta-helix repeat protein
VVRSNAARDNGDFGITVEDSSVVLNNTAVGNGFGSSANPKGGIHALPGSTVIGDTATNNFRFGLDLEGVPTSGFANNVLVGNQLLAGNRSSTRQGGTEIGPNLCNTSTTCP